MTVAYRPAYSVTMVDIDDGQPIAAAGFGVPPATQQRLADLGLVFQSRSGGFQLYAGYTADGARRSAVSAETRLSFGLRSLGPGFPQRYRPVLVAATGSSLYLTNRTAAGAVRAQGDLTIGTEAASADAARIVSARFIARVALGAAPRPTGLALSTAYAPIRSLPDVPITALSGEAEVPVDLRAAPERVFTLTPKTPGAPKLRLVVDDTSAAEAMVGLLDLIIRPDAGSEPAAGRSFTAKFRRRP